jgi:hypothetical protein
LRRITLRKPRERDITLGLPSEAYGKLQKGIAGQSSEQFQRELRAIGSPFGVS